MVYQIPEDLKVSYINSSDYPENLIPSDIFTEKTKLASYRKRLDDVENDFCLMTEKDEVVGAFEIPVIDIGKGKHALTIFEAILNHAQYARSCIYIHRRKLHNGSLQRECGTQLILTCNISLLEREIQNADSCMPC